MMQANMNAEYWQQEHIKLHRRVEKDALKLDKLYRTTMKNAEEKLELFYSKYAIDNSITEDIARKTLSPVEYKKFNLKMKEYLKSGKYADDAQFIAMIDKTQFASKIDIKQRLIIELREKIADLRIEQKPMMEESLVDTYNETYLQIDENFTLVSEPKLRVIINTKFEGQRFSDRIWGLGDRTFDRLEKELLNNFAQGKNWNKTKANLKATFGATDYEARRLLITETARINSIAKQHSYIEAGFEAFKFKTVHDDRVSDICLDHEDKEFLLEDLDAGLNAPPLHVYCRSYISPLVELSDV